VEEYGVDPNGADEDNGWTALHYAAEDGRVRTVKHLVEKHNVDIHERDWRGKTALVLAEAKGRTECADYLRGYGAKTGEELEEEDSTESDDDWDSDDSDNSDADDDVM
jgi:ankyrin repeat protein